MPTIQIPFQESGLFTKPSRGDKFGALFATRNIDLNRMRGKIRLSERTYRVFDSGDDADFELPVKFIRTNADQTDRWFALVQAEGISASDGLLFKSTDTSPVSAWAQDAIATSPTDAGWDMEIFGQASAYDRLVVARDDDLTLLNNGAWTASWWVTTLGQSAMSTANPHLLEQFLNLLIVTDGNKIHTIDDSLVVNASRVTLPLEYQIIWTAKDEYRVYFGTKHRRGGEAFVFPWDGTSQTYDTPIPVYDSISMAGVSKEGVLHTINGKGQLLANNGNSFQEVAALPIATAVKEWVNKNVAGSYRVHANGMALIDGNIHVLLDGRMLHASAVPTLEDQLSGIWEYDPDLGFYNKYSLGQYDGATDNDWGAGRIAFAGAIAETRREEGRFLAGATVYSDAASTELDCLIATKGESTVTQRGYFVTPKMSADQAVAFWRRMTAIFKKLKNSTDRIVVKYRTEEDAALIRSDGGLIFFTATWSDTDTFTVSAAGFSAVAVGDEIEVICGTGAGATAHVSSVTGTTPNFTCNLDETIPNVTGTAIVRVQNWTKLGTVSSQSILRKTYRIAKKSPWIQFKVELRGDHQSPEIEKILAAQEEATLI